MVSYRNTSDSVTVGGRFLPLAQNDCRQCAAYTIISTWPMCKKIREYVTDPVLYRDNRATTRNFEASYGGSELERDSRDSKSFALQEYFVPIDSLMTFMPRTRDVVQRHQVNVVNVSIRHAPPDPGTDLAWAPNDVFAFVLYYQQRTDPSARREVARWTRELIDAALVSDGR